MKRYALKWYPFLMGIGIVVSSSIDAQLVQAPAESPPSDIPKNAVVISIHDRRHQGRVAAGGDGDLQQGRGPDQPIPPRLRRSVSGSVARRLEPGHPGRDLSSRPSGARARSRRWTWPTSSGKTCGQPPLVSEACPPVVYAATGFAMWRPMAEALGWPDQPIGWDEIVALSADPQGWGSYGHPEWGAFKFGHAHPEHSTTGLTMLATLAYNALDRTDGLTPELVKSDPVREAFRAVEAHTYHYGLSTRFLMTVMAERGPSYLHAVTSSETSTLKTNEVNKDSMRFPFVFIFPAEGAFWMDNPFCILDGDWVSAEQHEAAGLYRDFLLEPAQQDLAVTIGLRPADPAVAAA